LEKKINQSVVGKKITTLSLRMNPVSAEFGVLENINQPCGKKINHLEHAGEAVSACILGCWGKNKPTNLVGKKLTTILEHPLWNQPCLSLIVGKI